MQIKRLAVSALAALVVVAAAPGCGSSATPANNAANTATAQLPPAPHYAGPVVATYAGGEVTKEELDKQYALLVLLPGNPQQESKSQFLTDYIVWYKYLYQQASQSGVKVDAALARQTADGYVQQLVGGSYKTKDDVLQAMKKLGVSEDDLVLLAAKGQVLQAYLKQQLKDLKVSDAQARAYYNQHLLDFTQVTVEHILVSTLSQAKDIEAQLKSGANFAALADKYSIDPGVKQNHGKYADQMASMFVPEFAKACATLPIGQISDPVHTQYGYHVLRVDKRTVLPFDQVKSQVTQQLLNNLQQAQTQSIYQNAVKSANIKVKVKDSDL